MNSPALPGLTRALGALLVAAVVTVPQVERVRGQEAKQPTEHQAVPPVDLGQVIDKGALRLLPSKSVTRHDIATDSGPISYTATAGTLGAARPVRRAHRGGVLRRHTRRTRQQRSNGR